MCFAADVVVLSSSYSISTHRVSAAASRLVFSSRLVSSRRHGRGDRAVELGLFGEADRATDLRREYGDLGMTVEVVDGMDSAIRHIHKYGR